MKEGEEREKRSNRVKGLNEERGRARRGTVRKGRWRKRGREGKGNSVAGGLKRKRGR